MLLDLYDPEGNVITEEEWVAMRALNLVGDQRFSRKTMVDETRVSTVWLGIDHSFLAEGPPLIWETMLFPEQLTVTRYPTREAAYADHERIVDALKHGYPLEERF